jgi:hypothetical protein
MATGDARPIPIKGVAYRVTFPILDADGDLVTGATGLDSERSLDGAAFADCTNEATEIATASGMYFLDLTIAEMTADTVAIIVKTTTSGAKTTVIVLYPQEIGDIKVDMQSIASDQVAANNQAAAFNLSKTAAVIGRGTCTTGGSTTSITTSAFTPNGVAAGQFIGRIITFDALTATTQLRGQSTDITNSSASANPTFTVTALTNAPVSGDTFSVT